MQNNNAHTHQHTYFHFGLVVASVADEREVLGLIPKSGKKCPIYTYQTLRNLELML